MTALALIAAGLSLVYQAAVPAVPEGVVARAKRAVEGDSVAVVARQWKSLLRRDPTHRAAHLGLATLSQYTQDFTAAELHYRALLPPPGRVPDGFAREALLGLGLVVQGQGDWRASEPWLTQAVQAARAARDTTLEAEAIVYLAAIRNRMAGFAAAESLYTSALAARGGGARAQGFHRCGHAFILAGQASSAAEGLARSGLDLARRAGDPRLEATCLRALGQQWFFRGQADSAATAFGELVEVRRRLHDGWGLAAALQMRGWVTTALGSYGLARQDLLEAVRTAERVGNTSALAWSLANLGDLAAAIGNFGEGMAQLERATEMFTAQGDLVGVASASSFKAELARATGDYQTARRLQQERLADFERLGSVLGMTRARNAIANLAMGEGDWTTARTQLDSARALARRHGMTGWERGMKGSYARLALMRGDLDEVEALLVQRLNEPHQPSRGYQMQAQLAEIFARRGQIDSAAARLAEGLNAMDRWRARLNDRDMRVVAFQVREQWLDPDLGVATVLSAVAGAGRVAAAFELAERTRARDLLDQFIRFDAMRTAGAVPSAALMKARTTYAGVSLAELQASLPDARTALLEFVTGRGGEPTTLFVITGDTAVAYGVAPVDSIAAMVSRYVSLVESGRDPRALSSTLGTRLLAPALEPLPPSVDRLVIVRDDVLHLIPFDALTLTDGRYLIERFSVSYVPSAAIARRLWLRPPSDGSLPLLAMADPDFGDLTTRDVGEGGVTVGLRGGDALPRLRGTRREARALARLVRQAEVRLRKDASETFLKAARLDRYRILHFATHAFVDQRSLSRTALVLAPGEGEDGLVGPGDLAALALDADLVVLSACRTAGGVVVDGEGIQGLTAPLLEAGARAVFATGWRIDDEDTVPFVQEYYRRLADGLSVGDALRAAKLDGIGNGVSPAVWAAFSVVGDPAVRVRLH